MRERGLAIDQVSIDVSLMSFMTVIDVFFVGFLISNYDTQDISVSIPITLLMLSLFGFLFSTLILANAASQIVKDNENRTRRYNLFGFVMSEYLGIYPLVVSIPLIINIVSGNAFIRGATLAFALAGLWIYKFQHFSILEEHFPKHYKKLSFITLLLAVLLFTTQILGRFFMETAFLFVVFVLLLSWQATRTK